MCVYVCVFDFWLVLRSIFKSNLSSLYIHKYYNSHNMAIIKVGNKIIIIVIILFMLITKNVYIYEYILITL